VDLLRRIRHRHVPPRPHDVGLRRLQRALLALAAPFLALDARHAQDLHPPPALVAAPAVRSTLARLELEPLPAPRRGAVPAPLVDGRVVLGLGHEIILARPRARQPCTRQRCLGAKDTAGLPHPGTTQGKGTTDRPSPVLPRALHWTHVKWSAQ